MNKEQFVAMSLPHSLKCISAHQNYNGKIVIVDGVLNRYWDYDVLTNVDNGWTPQFNINIVKPILHPLSDLTKEIEHGGEKIIMVNELKHIFGFDYVYSYATAKNGHFNPYAVQFGALELLIKFHFDICGLIEKGEAIDVNTLDVNPYK